MRLIRDKSHGAYAVHVTCLACGHRLRLADAWVDIEGPLFCAYYCVAGHGGRTFPRLSACAGCKPATPGGPPCS